MPRHERTQYACGSEQAYQAHCRRGEPIDEVCRAAHREASRSQRASGAAYARDGARRAAIQALIFRHEDEFRALLAAARREAAAEDAG